MFNPATFRRLSWVTIILAIVGVAVALGGVFFEDDLFNCIGNAYINGWSWLYWVEQSLLWVVIISILFSWILSLILTVQKPKSKISLLFVFLTLLLLFVLMVITSLSTARTKARESVIMASISALRSAIGDTLTGYAITTNSCYAPGSVFVRSGVAELIVAAEKNNYPRARCYSTSEAWAVSIALAPSKSRPGIFCQQPDVNPLDESRLINYCTDSTGFAGRKSSPITGSACSTAPDLTGY